MALQDTIEQLQNFDFNELDVNNIGSWPTPVKAILMMILFVAVLGGGYYLHLTDKQTMLDRVEVEEVNLRKDYESKSRQAANLDAYRRQREEMRATFGSAYCGRGSGRRCRTRSCARTGRAMTPAPHSSSRTPCKGFERPESPR